MVIIRRCMVVLLVIGLVLGGGIGAVYADTQKGMQNQVQETHLDVNPMNPQKAANGLQKMSTDLQTWGQNASVPLALWALLIGVITLVTGLVFSKRLAVVGIASIGGSLVLLVILGDVMKSIEVLQNLAVTVRTWF